MVTSSLKGIASEEEQGSGSGRDVEARGKRGFLRRAHAVDLKAGVR